MKRLIGVCLLAVVLTACGTDDILSIFSSDKGKIVFGTGTLDDGVTNEKTTFSPDEDFISEVEFSSTLDRNVIDFTIIRDSGSDLEETYEEWDVRVDPSWNYLVYEFHDVDFNGAFDPGFYIVRIHAGDTQIAEGRFRIE